MGKKAPVYTIGLLERLKLLEVYVPGTVTSHAVERILLLINSPRVCVLYVNVLLYMMLNANFVIINKCG